MNKHQTIEQFPINKLESDSTIESLQQENAALKADMSKEQILLELRSAIADKEWAIACANIIKSAAERTISPANTPRPPA